MRNVLVVHYPNIIKTNIIISELIITVESDTLCLIVNANFID